MKNARTGLSSGGATVSLALFSMAPGCSKVSQASASAESERTQAAAPSRPSLDNANYRAEIRSTGSCKKDNTCTAEVEVEAKGDYHINDKYPYRFKVEDPPPPGLKYPKAVIGKEDGTMDLRKVVLKVPFIAESVGDKKVAG